jgi:glycosyltransferase involved in cell wall biosynthesis
MKVLLFTSIYPSLREPTRGPYNHSVFKAVAARCEARVVSPQPFWNRVRKPSMLVRVPHETQTGIDTLLPTFWSVPRATALHARAMYTSLRPLVGHIHREFPFDAIFAVWAYPDAVAASFLARDFGCPLVIKIMGSDINEAPRDPALRGQIKAALERAACVVTVSEALRERVIELGIAPEKVKTQHNGVDGEKFALRDRNEVRRSLGVREDRPALCYVGRLGHEKGVDVLIEAMGVRKAAGKPNVDLHIVGGGEEGEVLRARVKQLSVEAQVHFHGMRPHAEVPLWISACDVLALPSRREGCPNVVLEALASGRPVVASRVGGVPEIIAADGSNGVLVPSDEPAALASGLDEALGRTWDPVALRNTVKFLSWDAVGAEYFNTVRSAVEQHQMGRRSAAGQTEHTVALAGAGLRGSDAR